MATLSYGMITSLDGYVADANGRFDWGIPSDEQHEFVNQQESLIDTFLYGRRLYEIMVFWETHRPDPGVEADYAEIWRARNKIVVSSTLDAVTTDRTSLIRSMDVTALQTLKRESSGTLSIGGPTFAANAIRAGLVDEFQFYVCPLVVGGGLRALPEGAALDLELVENRRFDNGVVFSRYRPR